jgi:uncharacterized protein (TIGR00369 family)
MEIAMALSTVPYAAHTGVDLIEVAPGAAIAVLDQRDEVSNHIGTMHAGALFTLGETASGGAMVGTFKDLMGQIRPVAANASIRYTRLAKGKLTAQARCSEAPEALRGRLDADGKVAFDVEVDIQDADGQSVAGMTVAWHVRRT